MRIPRDSVLILTTLDLFIPFLTGFVANLNRCAEHCKEQTDCVQFDAGWRKLFSAFTRALAEMTTATTFTYARVSVERLRRLWSSLFFLFCYYHYWSIRVAFIIIRKNYYFMRLWCRSRFYIHGNKRRRRNIQIISRQQMHRELFSLVRNARVSCDSSSFK